MSGLCIGCLFASVTLEAAVYSTPCCSRDLCAPCLQRLPNCPICKIAIDRSQLRNPRAPVTQPPPYLGLARGPTSHDDLPSYNDDDADDDERERNLSGIHIHDESSMEPVPSYDTQGGSAASFLNIAELKTTEDGILAIHYVSSHDTLVGLSLKYNVPVDEIRKANRMFSSNIHEREKLIIPGVHQLPKSLEMPSDEMQAERERVRRAKRFQLATKCGDKEEANYYLGEFDYDVDKAVARYLEDLEWERTHKPPSGYGKDPKGPHRRPLPPHASFSNPLAAAPSSSPSRGETTLRSRNKLLFGLF